MSSSGRGARQFLEAAGFRGLLLLVRTLPYGAAVGVGTVLGRLAFALGLRRKVAVRNVEERLAPPGGRAEAERIARESYAVAGRTFVHLLRVDRIDDRTLWRLLSREEFESVREFREGEARSWCPVISGTGS